MSLIPLDPDPAVLRSAFSQFPTGVVALAAVVDGEQIGLVASSFTVGVSQEPPLVMFAVQNSSTTWPVLRTASRIGVSVLAAGHDLVCRQLSSRKGDRFRDLEIETTSQGSIFVKEAPIWLECSIENEVPAGDHHVVILRVESLRVEAEIDPLVYHRSSFRLLARSA